MVDIAAVHTVEYEVPDPERTTDPWRDSWLHEARVANPMTRYPRYAEVRSEWTPSLEGFGVVVEATDGTVGFATGWFGTPVAALIEEYLGKRIVGESVMATEKVHDMLVRLSTPVGTDGIASYAVSAIDLALWDLKGRLLERPVYELLGGPSTPELTCYATGNDTDWHMELGFEGTKLACPYGPADGAAGLRKNVAFVDAAAETVGQDVEIMLDCWMAFDETYTVRLANRLDGYDLAWFEETLPPNELEAHAALRDRLPHQTLATGEHWYTATPFQRAASQRLVDIFQPDVAWVGGLTTLRRICAIADAAGLTVIPHAGGSTPFGQHACYALPGIPWAEYFIPSPPGVPLDETGGLPGVPTPTDGTLVPSDDPGFGVDLDRVDIVGPFFGSGDVPAVGSA
jgi:L-rhamnonate dehydratase